MNQSFQRRGLHNGAYASCILTLPSPSCLEFESNVKETISFVINSLVQNKSLTRDYLDQMKENESVGVERTRLKKNVKDFEERLLRWWKKLTAAQVSLIL